MMMTRAEALDRWPPDDYPPDTIGGMRRESVLDALQERSLRAADPPWATTYPDQRHDQ